MECAKQFQKVKIRLKETKVHELPKEANINTMDVDDVLLITDSVIITQCENIFEKIPSITLNIQAEDIIGLLDTGSRNNMSLQLAVRLGMEMIRTSQIAVLHLLNVNLIKILGLTNGNVYFQGAVLEISFVVTNEDFRLVSIMSEVWFNKEDESVHGNFAMQTQKVQDRVKQTVEVAQIRVMVDIFVQIEETLDLGIQVEEAIIMTDIGIQVDEFLLADLQLKTV